MIKVYDEIYNCLLNESQNDYLKAYKNDFLKILKQNEFKDSLKNIVLKNQYDALSILELFYPLYRKYWDISSEDWLKYIYNWVLNKSYPNQIRIRFNDNLQPLIILYLNLLRSFSYYEKKYDNTNFLNKYPIDFLTEEEETNTQSIKEYLKFKNAFLENWIYELMKIDKSITGHNTIDHVIGVNYISLSIARQLKQLNLPVDLGIVNGASLGHDIGKYGVRSEEIERVPYLHYYYTEEWFNKFHIEKIGHIATNHSTWDLELENLPLESLILIYADFRVKNKVENNIYKMHIYSLEEAYSVILNKLDNLDNKKEQRYDKVYRKLKDFEDYIISLGVDIDLTRGLKANNNNKPYALMNNEEIVNNIKYFSIEHNINLMAKLLDDTSFNNILEMARSEYDWRKLRLYLQIFQEYSTYLTQSQKKTTLYFLTDLLFHKEEDIRKESAELIGVLISQYDEEYRKELPKSIKKDLPIKSSEDILDDIIYQILYPDHKMLASNLEWQYNLKTIIKSLFYNSNTGNYEKYSKVLIKYYNDFQSISAVGQLYLSQTIKYIPIHYLNEEYLNDLHNYILNQLNLDVIEIKLTVLDIIDEIYEELKNSTRFISLLKEWVLENIDSSPYPAENYLKYKLALNLKMEKDILNSLKSNYKKDEDNIPEIFLTNLKTATSWMKKKVNIDILYDQVKKFPDTTGLHTGMHFCNLLKVSAVEKVRNYAGHTLLNIFEFLSLEERNDIAIELLRALEMQNYQFTKYIPDYLGQLFLYLQPRELDELIDDFENKIKKSNTQVIFLILKTTGICIENYPKYNGRFVEDQKDYENRLQRLLSILLNGMTSFDKEIKTEAFRILSGHVFNSDKLILQEKQDIFQLIGKKFLTLLTQKEDDEFIFLNNSASLNHIYRFILDYEFYHGNLELESKDKIAFFPGSFDPFSLSHKEIALEIRNHGFEVYLAVDEFSWSKRTQAHKFRRDIINMTIGHEKDIFLFPSETPINISNNEDLKKLRNVFNDKEVYMVVGTDVLVNASAYDKDGFLNNFSHIVFDRKSLQYGEKDNSILEERIKNINGDVLRLSLPAQYEDISSTQIRESIDLDRDISRQIDPLAQQYIYNYGLYLKEPQYKSLVQTKTIEIEILKNEDIDNSFIEYLNNKFASHINIGSICELQNKLEPRILLVKNSKDKSILGFSTFYWINNTMLYDEFQNTNITKYLRQYSTGKIVLISGVYSKSSDEYLIDTILNETLAHCVVSDYNYAIFKNSLIPKDKFTIENNLKLQGFIETPFNYDGSPICMVDMNNPITLNQDIEVLLKPPFDENPQVKKVIQKTRRSLKESLTNLYPGELLLSLNKDMIYSKLIQKVCDTNKVPIIQEKKRVLGEYTCVPFGSILNGTILPNTITKTMHTEKVFNSNIDHFTISASPNYLNLENQSRVLYSFNRPLILVDDILHKGYRINTICPLLSKSKIDTKKIIVGILTGRGKEIAKIKNIDVDYAYFIPNLKLWFNESDLYPFIGGDMVLREDLEENHLIPSVNLILPYISPSFIKQASAKSIYDLSKTCLVNTMDVFKIIEKVYQEKNGKSLIIKNLGQVLVTPRRPDIYRNMDSSTNLKPSTYIKADIEHLKRIKNMIQ